MVLFRVRLHLDQQRESVSGSTETSRLTQGQMLITGRGPVLLGQGVRTCTAHTWEVFPHVGRQHVEIEEEGRDAT